MDTKKELELKHIKKLLPKGEYYENTSCNFKDNLQIATEHCAICLKAIQNQAQILSDTMLERWEKLLETSGKDETSASLSWKGGNSLKYITEKAKKFDPEIKVEVEDVYIVTIRNVTFNPVLPGTFLPEIAKEVRFLQKIKPAYMIFKYYDRRGVRVYSGV